MLYTGARGRKQKNPKVSVLKEEIGHLLHTGHHEAPTPGKPKRCLYVLYSCILENLVAVQSVLMLHVLMFSRVANALYSIEILD